MAIISFTAAIRQGASDRKERHYLDYLVDNRPLRGFLPPIGDLISPFGWFKDKQYERELIEQLTLVRESELKTGRVRLYICPECGDIECGSVTVELIEQSEAIVWQQFANETGYGGIMEDYPDVPPIMFDKASYMRAFMRLHQGIY